MIAGQGNATKTKPRRGRPKAGERALRQARILDAAEAELIAKGYDGVTMQTIAARAGASKETLYVWFGSREALFTALVERNAEVTAARVEEALDTDAAPDVMLSAIAASLLTLLTGARSVALNRAAMVSPPLAKLLLASGRYRIGPMIEAYLARLARLGVLATDDCAEAFRVFYGLVIQDSQIRVLLGEPAPGADEIELQAQRAAKRLFHIYGDPDGL